MADVTLAPDDLIRHADRDAFDQEAMRILETGMRELRLAREAGEMEDALRWWSAVATLNRALTERRFIDEAAGLERESRLAALLAGTFGKEHIASEVDFDDIAARTAAALPTSYERAAAKALHWTQLPREEILRLRYAKEIIGALEQLAPYAEQVTRIPHWDEWRELKSQLP